MGKLFGTDGIRSEANVFPMTSEVAMKVGRALVYTLLQQPQTWQSKHSVRTTAFPSSGRKQIRIVIGKDTRRSGYMIETALASGICSMGGDAILLGPLPTPGVAFVTSSMRADAGVMISASHNPFQDNGIKIFGADGFKAPDGIEAAIERLVLDPTVMEQYNPTGMDIGRAQRIEEAHGRYIVFLKSTFPAEYDLSGMKLALDCANGAAYKAAPMAFEELGAEVVTRGVSPNGRNINEESGALHPEALAKLTVESGAELGIALDGDADRVILVDETGSVIDGDVVIGLCALELKNQGKLKNNKIVTTPMSNVGLELTLKENGIEMLRANVGDRFVVETMRREGLNLGGEQSGHIIFLDHSTTGDGALAALKVIELMKRTGKRLSELKTKIRLLPQVLVNLNVKERRPLESLPCFQAAHQQVQKTLAHQGRVFVRYSGTEAKVRILVEGEKADQVSQLAQLLKEAILKDFAYEK
jgi:phosphoglucosamine mutase